MNIIEISKKFGSLYEDANIDDLVDFAAEIIKLSNQELYRFQTMKPVVWMAENEGFNPTFLLERPDYAIDVWIPLYDHNDD